MGGSGTVDDFRVRDLLSRSISLSYGNARDFIVMAAVVGLPQFVAMILTIFMEPDFEKATKDPKQGILGLIVWLLLIATGVLW
ncbi:MAG: hypothetical protein KKF41_11110 [Actinobacteria bacterium]|nr:hypothetical protein [Actinomycetota bacterium]MBU1944919.1 hypothetical protein [Actinomycetota bacterium]MBU2688123.1 hypothetical protein [Actinomycetota bacterium]